MIGKRGGIGRFIFVWSILFVVLLTAGFFTASYYILDYADTYYKSDITSQKNMVMENKYHDLAQHLFSKNNFSSDYRESPILVIGGKPLYAPIFGQGVGIIYTNCNLNSYVCERKTDFGGSLKSQFNLQNFRKIIKTKDQNKNVILILIPLLQDQALLNIPTYSILPNNLKIYREINQKYRSLYSSILSQKKPTMPNKINIIKLFLNGYYHHQTKNNIIASVDLGLKLSEIRQTQEYAEEEYQYLNNSNTIDKYKKTIEKYYPSVQTALKKPEPKSEMGGLLDIYYRGGNLFYRSHDKFISKTLFFKEITDLSLQLNKTSISSRKTILKDYQDKDIKESNLSKLLRLKVLKVKMAELLLGSCERKNMQECLLNTLQCQVGDNVNECVIDFIEEVGSGELCDSQINGVWLVRDTCYCKFPKQYPHRCKNE